MVIKDIEVLGVKALQRELTAKADTLLRPSLLKGLRAGAKVIRKEMSRRTPKRKGALLRALRVRAHRGKNDVSWASVGISYGKSTYLYKGKMVKPFYAHMVHNGTIVGEDGKRIKNAKLRIEKGKQRIKPNPWIYDAFMEAYGPVSDITLEKFMKMLTK